MVLSIERIGSEILRETAPAVDPLNPQLAHRIADLIATAAAGNGVGIAAPQVGISERLMIVASRPTPRYPFAPTMEPTAMLNPRILDRSTEMVADWEGCLSVPDLRGLVPRHQKITVEYQNIRGELVRQELSDFVARIFQHELDHLNGILFPDRAIELITEAEYQKIVFDR